MAAPFSACGRILRNLTRFLRVPLPVERILSVVVNNQRGAGASPDGVRVVERCHGPGSTIRAQRRDTAGPLPRLGGRATPEGDEMHDPASEVAAARPGAGGQLAG